jgi:iron(III) transport system permease protein
MTRRFSFSPTATLVTWALCALALGPFLVYPVGRVMWGAFVQDGAWQPSLLLMPFTDPNTREAMLHSLTIGVLATIVASLIAVPLAYFTSRLRFAGKSFLSGLLLVPLLLPPLVGAVGLRQMLGREGVLNTIARELNLISEPIEWLQMKIPMIAVVSALHLYPLIYLNLSAAWANIDPTLEEAAENMGAGGWRLWRTVTLPLLLPGYLAGALIVFIAALTDLGTPLVFDYQSVAAVLIFDAKTTLNPSGYVVAFWLTLLAALIFWVSRHFLDSSSGRIATLSRGTSSGRERNASMIERVLVYLIFFVVIFLALLPHLGVVLASFARDWTARLLPQWTSDNYSRVFNDSETLSSIKTSLWCAALSMTIDVVAGFALAYALVRGKVWGRVFLDTVAMLPLALPGLVLAFGLLTSFIGTPLSPLENALPLLVISYAVRRLPYALRAVSGGLQQMSVTLEEASLNLGATPLQTVWRVTRPLVTANLLAAGLLTFAFAVLEVSDSLILTLDNQTVPIAKMIYELSIATTGGTFLACALGVVGMALLTVTFMFTNRLLGKQLGALFRV